MPITKEKVVGNCRYTFGVYDDENPAWCVAHISRYDDRDYGPKDHRPYGIHGLIGMTNYATMEEALTAWDALDGPAEPVYGATK